MEDRKLSGRETRLHMRYEKAWPTSAQGMGIWEDRAFVLYDTGACAVYDLAARTGEALDVFKLGSYNDGVPTRDYLNHANDCMFSRTHYRDNPIPLLYVTIGTGTGGDEDGFFYRCAVENIVRTVDGAGREHYQAQTLQTIAYRPGAPLPDQFVEPCWGCPAWLMDPEEGCLYIFSAKYRTKRGCIPDGEQNRYIITKFPLPDPERGGLIRLTAEDILDQFTVSSEVCFTQGGTIHNGKLYYTFGLPKKDYPNTVMAFDLREKRLLAVVEALDEAMFREEIECCAVYDGSLMLNTNGGFGIYRLAAEGLPL